MQYISENKVDVVIISDPYRINDNGCDMLTDTKTGRAAIMVAGNQVSVANVIRDSEFVSARVGGYQIYSCYATPNPNTRDAFNNHLLRLENRIRSIPQGNPKVVAGDFNARSKAWGDQITTKRGVDLGDLFASLQLIVQNVGSTPTFTGGEGSIEDVTATSAAVVCSSWRVLNEEYNHSDHCYVTFGLGSHANVQPVSSDHVFRGWNMTKGINHDLLEVGLIIADWLNPVSDHRERYAHNLAEVLEDHISAAYDIALPRRSASIPIRKPVHWCNTEISVLRKSCTSAKRNTTRLVARAIVSLQTHDQNTNEANADAAEAAAQLRKCIKSLKTAIAKSKKSCWES